MQDLTIEQWVNGTTKQRTSWLNQHYTLGTLSQQILQWAESFRGVGCSISNEQMVALWRQTLSNES